MDHVESLKTNKVCLLLFSALFSIWLNFFIFSLSYGWLFFFQSCLPYGWGRGGVHGATWNSYLMLLATVQGKENVAKQKLWHDWKKSWKCYKSETKLWHDQKVENDAKQKIVAQKVENDAKQMAASSKNPPCCHEDLNSIFLNAETVLFLHQVYPSFGCNWQSAHK